MNLNLGKNVCPKLAQAKQKLKIFYFQKRIDFSDQGYVSMNVNIVSHIF